ncbi:anthranilate phosphoribosyltransferase [Paenibacillus sp. L3-i20]|uniref:anthranilate phosphoribosyltransferase n=1 Tax=Paenibacillus sp. L3-i20 TaxID=2905833 RepID=UPI001EDCBFB3|nr:anthranilate phosphoribosyltransferase [Paenibacillus sp. L3-i20]GKU79534.1 anthranilate phosphoribosyltransferase [Paenibacillus sp. L3-i20]
MSRTITIQQALNLLVSGQHLSRSDSNSVMTMIMNGDASPAQIGAIATALRMKGETRDEIAGFAEVIRQYSNQVQTDFEGVMDTCGTGGSGIHKFNISTASSIITAAAGIRVAKHGNRAISGKTGSADVLEALGVSISLTAEQASKCLSAIGICFMFSQQYHPSLKHVAAPRRELGIRTIFNMLGPLANPAPIDRQLLGIYDRSRTGTIAEVLGELGLKHAFVVSSHDGLDEVSISAATQISELKNGIVTTYDIEPEDLGLPRWDISEVIGGAPEVNAAIIRNIFTGEQQGAYRDIVLANAGSCIYVGGLAESPREGVSIAAEVLDSGKAFTKLNDLIKMTGELAHVS